ncbi:PfkB family carbohydrate kinase [Glaciihabitans sp. dw_435]|uniref:carbohydrate kinase family protein n=1 Tax=Glaciihabitans sp. dw_435 TaxID=2720081 RepID=UPI001BD5C78A|nr:PfkB family carbohydrate kinase [Glaciihabitans sp. dw_435]
MTPSKLTVIGESLVDIIVSPLADSSEPQVHAGGSPLNVAIGATRLGLDTTLVTSFAEDDDGRVIRDHLSGNSVATIVAASPSTSRAIATLNVGGSASYQFEIAWDIASVVPEARASVQAADHVHVGSISTLIQPGAASVFSLVESARETATISFDPNCRPALEPSVADARASAERFVEASDIVKASNEDLKFLYPNRSTPQAAAAWLERGPSLVIVTRGAEGPLVLTPNGVLEVPSPEVDIADTVGAGDSFMSAIIAGLTFTQTLGAAARPKLPFLGEKTVRDLVTFAGRAAAITCSRAGANPPRLAELGAFTP